MLEVPEKNDFLILRFQLVTCRLKARLGLSPSRSGGRSQLIVAQLTDQVDRRFTSDGGQQGLLTIHTAARSATMPAMSVDHSIFGHLPKPQVGRHHRIL